MAAPRRASSPPAIQDALGGPTPGDAHQHAHAMAAVSVLKRLSEKQMGENPAAAAASLSPPESPAEGPTKPTVRGPEGGVTRAAEGPDGSASQRPPPAGSAASAASSGSGSRTSSRKRRRD